MTSFDYFSLIMFSIIIGGWIGIILPYELTKLVKKYEKNRDFKALIPVEVDEFNLCNNPHVWMEAIGVNEKYEYAPINICSKCGFIPSKNLMATKEGLRRTIENDKIRKFEEEVEKDFIDKEKNDINKLVEQFKADPTLDMATWIYLAGQSANKRYIIYKIARSEEKRREPKET